MSYFFGGSRIISFLFVWRKQNNFILFVWLKQKNFILFVWWKKNNFIFLLHSENMPVQIYWKFYNLKKETFQIKILIFFIFLLKI